MQIELNDETRWILGRPNFVCAPIFRALRLLGHEIPHKAEDEQAYSIWWMLNLYLEHGNKWRDVAEVELAKATEIAKAQKAERGAALELV